MRAIARAVDQDRHARRQHARGAAAQRAQRALEAALRRRALAAVHRGRAAGDAAAHIATTLDVDRARLRAWQRDHDQRVAQRRPAAPLGRPALLCSPARAAQLRHHLALFGPGIGVRTLRADFPEVAFRDCAHIAARFRRDLRQQFDDCTMVACTWTTPGTVWATDVWQVTSPIDGLYRYLLDVRDLASGYIIESMPLEHATAAAVGDTLERLYRTIGAPLVIKTDNGSEFTGNGSGDLHPLWGVEQLLSPPYTPQYNGACEAGHGSIRYRAEMLARRDGRPGDWSLDHLEGARTWANDLPRVPQGPTPQQIFASRAPISTAQRDQFRRACRAARQQRWNECLTAAHRQGRTIHLAASPATVSRAAISAALRNLGYLSTRSVPIRQPIPYEKTSVISQ